ncbi:cell wall hydrolase [Aurantiacibacter sp. MUD11]|uniref:cell wall hydrolase n=1 Tax=Aurantiacibacter sp. MUD11 TaxID=3003265 RepID=UPI0022AB02DB|nr:cell wall hydrolase [Aurantiacibacter sp. MUD11]WAT17988.1 cell wall hydrolase [Aurantiacibacter sp. MUD11]
MHDRQDRAGYAARVPTFEPRTPQQQLALRRRERAARRGQIARRVGVLAAMLAVPALAAETAFEPRIEQAPTAPTALMGFETPGESFPGSAFYYLEDTPPAFDVFAMESAEAEVAALTEPAAAAVTSAGVSLVVTGSDRDHARAQQCLAQAIYYEAASESDAGQRAVAQVVLNRVAHSAWPSTVCGVVYQGSARRTGCQFTFTCDGSLARRPSRGGWERASRIARAALAGSVYEPVGLSTHYHTLAVNPYWAPSLQRTTVIGAHVFYRWPGAAGERAAFATRYAGAEPNPGRTNSRAAGPDPVEVAQARTLAEVPAEAAEPVAPASAPAAAPAPAGNSQPLSGSVRPEYANSGRWIERP